MTDFIDTRKSGLNPLFVVTTLGLQLLLIVGLLGQWLTIYRLTQNGQVAYVQLQTGQAFQAQAVNAKARHPQVIRSFTSNTLYLLFNWSGQLEGGDGQRSPDKGTEITIEDQAYRVPTSVLFASYALTEPLQKPTLKAISELVPQGVYSSHTQALLTLDHVSQPKQLESGRWSVQVVGHHRISANRAAVPGKTVPFNKQIILEALSTPVVPTGTTPLEQAVYAVRQAGLQIIAINDIE